MRPPPDHHSAIQHEDSFAATHILAGYECDTDAWLLWGQNEVHVIQDCRRTQVRSRRTDSCELRAGDLSSDLTLLSGLGTITRPSIFHGQTRAVQPDDELNCYKRQLYFYGLVRGDLAACLVIKESSL